MSAILDAKYVKTRTPHRCFACCRDFPKGSRMHYQSQVEGSDYFRLYLCMTCFEIMDIEVKRGEDDFPPAWVADILPDGDATTPEELLNRLKARL